LFQVSGQLAGIEEKLDRQLHLTGQILDLVINIYYYKDIEKLSSWCTILMQSRSILTFMYLSVPLGT
jgi:hypothetical protein